MPKTILLLLCCCWMIPVNVWGSTADTTDIKSLLDASWAQMYVVPDSAMELADEALALAGERDLLLWEAKSYNQIGVVHWVRSEYDSALHWFAAAHDGFAELEDSIGMARVANNFGITYMALDYYELALQSFQDAMPGIQRMNDPKKLATLYNNMGMVSDAMEEHQQGIDFFKKAYNLIRDLPHAEDTAMLNNNIALSLREFGKSEASLPLHRRAIEGYRSQQNMRGLIECHYNYSGTLFKMGKLEKADSVLTEALLLARDFPNEFIRAAVWVNIAELRLRQKEFKAAIAASDSALALLKPYHGLKPQKAVFDVLAEAQANLGNYAAAYTHTRDVMLVSDSMLNTEKLRRLAELTIKYESELKDKEIVYLRQQEVLSQWQMGGLSVIVLLLVLIGVVVFRRQRAVIRREKALQEKTKEAAEARAALGQAQLEKAKLEQEQLAEAVRHKSKELSQLALGIIRHHELLQNLDRSLQSIRKQVSPELKNEVQELAVMVVRQLGAEKERQDLQLYLEEAEQRFFQILDARYPKLTARERRLCALVRMGYSSKDIAAIFNINPQSVDMGRYRLRKKLHPEMEVTLQAFLLQLDEEN